jgi:hypothetical protein
MVSENHNSKIHPQGILNIFLPLSIRFLQLSTFYYLLLSFVPFPLPATSYNVLAVFNTNNRDQRPKIINNHLQNNYFHIYNHLYICKEFSTNQTFLCKTKPNISRIGNIGKTKPALSLCPRYGPVLSGPVLSEPVLSEPVLSKVEGVEGAK